ncbi:MAG TPA: ABC transporter permease [Lachnospiraceae bacterium]|uniref:ABC transporter permease n=1 Tax=Anaerosporobacter sp. TaxID=1872529 RepID=UPI000ECE0D5A|nr:ABC transporter permease [Anaerosporobacter sp.]HAB62325.1 ABC transporter permease [Lachnospiraceae bacterium]
MTKLIKLELERINLRPYFISSAIFGIVQLVFTYFVAYVAQVEQEVQFMNYGNILLFTGVISTFLFGILSATMYARLIVEEYSGKRLALLFSYPVGRQKTFLAKTLIVLLFVMLSMFLCTMLSIGIFAITEGFCPIVSDVMTSDILITAFCNMLVSLVAVSAIGLLSMRIGFIKKSISTTLISAFILSGIYGNIAISKVGNSAISLIIATVSLLVILAILVTLSCKINHMEVE